METTIRTRPRTASRVRESEREEREEREQQFDLLTAALIGAAVGSAVTLLMRRGPRGQRPIAPVVRAAGRGARWAGERGLEGARWLREQGGELWDRIPFDEARERVGEYVDTAREKIDDAVESELKDLRKAIRRRRQRLGL